MIDLDPESLHGNLAEEPTQQAQDQNGNQLTTLLKSQFSRQKAKRYSVNHMLWCDLYQRFPQVYLVVASQKKR